MQTSYRQQIRVIQKYLARIPIESDDWKALNDAASTIFAKSMEDFIGSLPKTNPEKWWLLTLYILSFCGCIFLLEWAIKIFF